MPLPVRAALVVLLLAGAAQASTGRQLDLLPSLPDGKALAWEASGVTIDPAAGGVRLRFAGRAWWRSRWPTLNLDLAASQLQAGDWRAYDALALMVTGDAGGPVLLRLCLTDRRGRQARQIVAVPAGETRAVSVPLRELGAQVDLAAVARFQLYLTDPLADCTLYLRRLALVAAPLQLSQVELRADPWEGGQLRLAAQAPRPLRWQVQMADAQGQVVAVDTAEGAVLDWRGPRVGAGECRVALVAIGLGLPADTLRKQWHHVPAAAGPDPPPVVLWCEPSTRPVQLDSRPGPDTVLIPWSAPGGQAVTGLSLDMARGEVEAAQLVALAGAAPLQIAVRLIPPRRFGGRDSLVVSSFRVGYVRTREWPPYFVRRTGWWPDPLLRTDTATAAVGECLALWVSCQADTATPPGEYHGAVVLSRPTAAALHIPLQVRVWPARVPAPGRFRTACTWNEENLPLVYGPALALAMRPRYRQFLSAHRLNPDHLYRRQPPAVDAWVEAARRGVQVGGNLLYVDPTDARRLPELAAMLDPVVARLTQAGLLAQAYVYGFDEAEASDFAALGRLFAWVHDRYPGLRTVTTARDPSLGLGSGLDRVVDTWVPLTALLDSAAARAAQARGRQVWWYVCSVPNHPYANLMLEYPCGDARLLGWQAWRAGVQGFLYYALNRWPRPERPMVAVADGRTDWDPASFGPAHGDGCLLYAGVDGPVSTLRLENLRDGLEDLELLAQADPAWARPLCARIVPSLDAPDRNPEALTAARLELLRDYRVAAAPP
jgi:hypothetical protein